MLTLRVGVIARKWHGMPAPPITPCPFVKRLGTPQRSRAKWPSRLESVLSAYRRLNAQRLPKPTSINIIEPGSGMAPAKPLPDPGGAPKLFRQWI